MLKKLLAVLLTLSLLMSLAACGNTADSSDEGATSEQKEKETVKKDNKDTDENATVTTGGDSHLSAPGEYPIVDEKVTVSALFTAHQFVEDFNTNTLTKHLEELTNIQLDIEVSPSDAQNEKINILFAGGDYPDMLLLENLSKDMVVAYGDQGYFVPLNDLIEEHAPNIKALMEEYPDFAAGMKTPDGTIYALPRAEGNWQVKFPVRAWIYGPWLETLGMDMPETLDEYYDYLVAVKNGDPNGNGDTTDEVPLAGAITGWYTSVFPFFMNSFVFTDPNTFLIPQDDGSMVFAPSQDEWRDGLRYLKKLYDEGLLASDSFVQEQAQLRQMGENPDAPILGTATGGWWGNMTINGGESGRYEEFTAMPVLEGPGGFRTVPEYDHTIKAQFFITDAAEDPAMLIKWADFFYDYEGSMMGYYGFEGREWRKAEDGELGVNGEQGLHFIIETFGGMQNDTWHHRAPGFNTEAIINGEVVDGDLEKHPTYRLASLTEENYAPYAKKAISKNIFFDADAVMEMSEIKTVLIGSKGSGVVPSYAARFITGDLDLDNDWDEYLSALESANVDRYVEIYESVYTPW